MPEMTRFQKFFVNRRGPRAYQRLLARLEAAGELPLGPSSQVLELGAGNGTLSLLVFERHHPARICITDYDPEQLVVAQKHVESRLGAIPPNLVLERGDALHLSYADATFDLVMAHQVLHHLGHVAEILQGLDEIKRVLRPRGRLLYAEMFHREAIREHLVKRGFTVAFHERRWRLLRAVDVVVALAP
jgi:ubiquinone/menaquinone biosynthesis C-methylase UbiE